MARARVQVVRARAAFAAAQQFEARLGWPRTLGEALQRYRAQERLPLRILAGTLRISPQHLSDVERGVRHLKPERAATWARALGVPVSTFVRLVLQHQVDGLHMRVSVEAA